MKKFLTLLLVLVLALGIAVPALAFTSDTDADDEIPYTLKIYLVEYEDNDLFGLATLPPSDRGYAKNEIVAAVVELFVPKGEKPFPTYGSFEFGGENVDLNVADNNIVYNSGPDTYTATIPYSSSPTGALTVLYIKDKDKLLFAPKLYNADSDETYKWLFFAKVEDDDASLFAKLVDGRGAGEFELDELYHMYLVIDGITCNIIRTGEMNADGDFEYQIGVQSGDYTGTMIYIDVDKNNASIGMRINPNTPDASSPVALGVNIKSELGIVDPGNRARILTSGDAYDDVMDVYSDIVVDLFNLDYRLIGNYVRDSYFEDFVSGDTITATVDIAPWTAYVTVPDNIVVDPPKTGDAASVMGFVMVALSSAGAFIFRKRG